MDREINLSGRNTSGWKIPLKLNFKFTTTAMASEESGMREACGVVGCLSLGPWPTEVDMAHVVCLGLTALQHRSADNSTYLH